MSSDQINVIQFSRDMLGDDVRIPDGATESLDAITAHELDAKQFDPVRWIIPGILPAGVTLLAGAPKIGKSWIMMDWCAAVASGGKVFGDIDVHPAHVLYLALEDNVRRLQSRLRKICRGHVPDFLRFGMSAPRIDTGLIPRLHVWMQKHPFTRLIVIDTLARIRPPQTRNADTYAADYLVGSQLIKVAAKYNLAIVLVHHTNKSKSTDELDLVSGSNGLSGGCDNVMIMTRGRGENQASLYITGRDIENEQTLELTFDKFSAQWMRSGSDDCESETIGDELRLFRLLRSRRSLSVSELMGSINLPAVEVSAIFLSLVERGVAAYDASTEMVSIVL